MRKAASIFVGLVFSLLVIAAVILFAPALLINETTLSLVRKITPRLGYTISWTDAEINVTSRSLLRKAVALKLRDLMLNGDSFAAKAPQLALAFEVSLNPNEVLVPRIGPGTVLNASLTLKTPTAPLDDEKKNPIDIDAFLSFVQERRIEPIRVTIDKFTTMKNGKSLAGSAQLAFQRPSKDTLDLSVSIRGERGAVVESLTLQALGVSGKGDSGLRSATVTGRARFEYGRTVALHATIQPLMNGRSRFTSDATVHMDGSSINMRTDGETNRHHLAGKVNAILRLPTGAIESIIVGPCNYDALSEDLLTKDVELNLACAGSLTRRDFRAKDLPVNELIPKRLSLSGTAKLALLVRNAQRLLTFHGQVDLARLAPSPLSLSGGFSVDGQVALKDLATPRKLAITFGAQAAVRHFEELIQTFAGTQWTIPAPLNQLRGIAQCSADGTINLVKDTLSVPVTCHTALSSPTQRLFVDAVGRFGRGSTHHAETQLTADVNLRDVQLVLPDIDLTKPIPRLLRDKRIGRFHERVSPPPLTALSYHINLTSPSERPVEIKNSLTKNPAKIALTLTLKNGEQPTGNFVFQPFEVTLYRRTASVEALSLTLDPATTAPQIDGLIQLPSTDYRVFVGLKGTTEKPIYQVYTEPALPDREALTVLLFGYRPEVLAEDELRTADEMRAAIADSAISLLSMFLLTSSPVESVGYNPHSGIFSVRMKLQKDLSLTVGTSAENSSEVGLRKRISRRWAVEGTAVTSRDDEESARAMLRWSKRY